MYFPSSLHSDPNLFMLPEKNNYIFKLARAHLSNKIHIFCVRECSSVIAFLCNTGSKMLCVVDIWSLSRYGSFGHIKVCGLMHVGGPWHEEVWELFSVWPLGFKFLLFYLTAVSEESSSNPSKYFPAYSQFRPKACFSGKHELALMEKLQDFLWVF